MIGPFPTAFNLINGNLEFPIDLLPLKSNTNSDMRFRKKENDIHSRKSKETLTKNQYLL